MEAIYSIKETETKKKEEATKSEGLKQEAGSRVVALATEGTGGHSDVGGYDGTDYINEVEECGMRGTKRRLKSAGPVRTDSGIAEFGDSMRETELPRLQLEERNPLL